MKYLLIDAFKGMKFLYYVDDRDQVFPPGYLALTRDEYFRVAKNELNKLDIERDKIYKNMGEVFALDD